MRLADVRKCMQRHLARGLVYGIEKIYDWVSVVALTFYAYLDVCERRRQRWKSRTFSHVCHFVWTDTRVELLSLSYLLAFCYCFFFLLLCLCVRYLVRAIVHRCEKIFHLVAITWSVWISFGCFSKMHSKDILLDASQKWFVWRIVSLLSRKKMYSQRHINSFEFYSFDVFQS